eukprot:TRINITY_DN7040_c0_g1_i1.p1 TRINITY_DN7040_c0_g1~~TRINITY_DN7040_c0_g1_i1.p1  ORF type:complete len:289 (+),score=73.20 TRINITY_DN7040_c0_g1_i1:31-867(+)
MENKLSGFLILDSLSPSDKTNYEKNVFVLKEITTNYFKESENRNQILYIQLNFKEKEVEFDHYQKILIHYYITLGYTLSPFLDVIILGPQDKENQFLERIENIDYFFTSKEKEEENLISHFEKKNTKIILLTKFPKSNYNPIYKIKQSYEHSVIGGTFDHLHPGHKILLQASSCCSSKSLTIGITGDKYISLSPKKYKELLQNFSERKSLVEIFCKSVNPNIELKIYELDDPFGPSIVDPLLQVIVVSEETFRGGEAVNKKKKRKGTFNFGCFGDWLH